MNVTSDNSKWLYRRGSRINTDRFPKQGGVPGHAFPGNTIGFNSLKSPYLGFWVIKFGQCIGQFHSPRMKPYKYKDYKNKFAPDIWYHLLYFDIFIYSYLKMDITIFQFSQSQVTKISKPESCNFYPQNSFNFIRYHDRVCFLSLTKRVGLTASRTNSCNSCKGWTIWIV